MAPAERELANLNTSPAERDKKSKQISTHHLQRERQRASKPQHVTCTERERANLNRQTAVVLLYVRRTTETLVVFPPRSVCSEQEHRSAKLTKVCLLRARAETGQTHQGVLAPCQSMKQTNSNG